ncbi:hypothetical protein J2X06_001600 [Lysobacter niastensis]|uniref:DUF3293 domain-containing protein n=1 Tax=Lysobacter niastensis TaxID=380629 RepID=A0ABU1WA28_9GAMM|nr:DUF3293 domain-containing protein [Lysobacter niastensis]MDR7134416.1 hypothetical protein [Lysobacter niastensis]
MTVIALTSPRADTRAMRELQIVDAAELATAYAAAEYVVVLDGDTLPLRVGQQASDLQAYSPAPHYAFITAWNPASEPRSDTANQAADALLVAQLDAVGAVRHPAWAQGPGGGWREPGWLVAGLDENELHRLALEFGQAGVLAWRAGEPVRLHMLMPRPPSARTGAHTDWIEAAAVDARGIGCRLA